MHSPERNKRVLLLTGGLLVLEEQATGDYISASAQAFGISLALSFLVKDPAIALLLTLLPTRGGRKGRRVMASVVRALSTSPVEALALSVT